MRDYDNELLKRNIATILDKSGMNQTEFAKIMGISQSRLSKLLGTDEGNRFSIEQIFKLSEKFNVSIDYLVTGKNQSTNTAKQICELLVQLFDNHYLESTSFSRDEEERIPTYYYDSENHMIPDVELRKFQNNYNALFFAEYWYPIEGRDYTEDELDELRFEANQVGNNLTDNIKINKFLNAFIPIHQLHIQAKMPDEAYEYTVNSLLSGI